MNIGVVKNLETLVLTPGDARSWALMPHALSRVADFCKKFDSDADPMMMVSQLTVAFPHPTSGVHVLMLLESGVPVGHMLVSFEDWFGTRYLSIIQLDIDEGKTISRQLARDTMKFVEDWGLARGANFIQCLARNEKVARAFRVFYGFQSARVIMRKTLVPRSTGVDDVAGNQIESTKPVSQEREH